MTTVWYVAITKPQRERYAAENVKRQGYNHYLPLRKDRAGRTVALFPRYLFVETDGQWRFLLSTFGVSNIVLFGDRPATMPHYGIEQLKAREGDDGLIALPEMPDDLQPGDAVRIDDHPTFAGVTGIHDGLGPQQMIRVLTDFMGGKVPVLVSRLSVSAL